MTILAGSRCIGVIGFVESRAFEDDPCREQYSADGSTAFGANRQGLVGHFLSDFKTMTTCFALIFIRRHTLLTSNNDAFLALIYSAFLLACQ